LVISSFKPVHMASDTCSWFLAFSSSLSILSVAFLTLARSAPLRFLLEASRVDYLELRVVIAVLAMVVFLEQSSVYSVSVTSFFLLSSTSCLICFIILVIWVYFCSRVFLPVATFFLNSSILALTSTCFRSFFWASS
jgi:hypothetical protein